jgi:FAD-dependent sensor of blue light
MLVRLMYASRAADSVNAEELAAILKKSKENNAASGVTGVLCFCFDADIFLQVLEGSRNAVSSVYNRIAQDPRHHDVVLLHYEEIGERHFSSWSMGQVNMNRLNPALLLKYSERSVLDPYSVSGKASLALFNELVATASVGVSV